MAANWRSISGVMSSSTLYWSISELDECALRLGGVGAVGNVTDVDGFAGDVEADVYGVGVVDEPGLAPTLAAALQILTGIAGMNGDQRLKDVEDAPVANRPRHQRRKRDGAEQQESRSAVRAVAPRREDIQQQQRQADAAEDQSAVGTEQDGCGAGDAAQRPPAQEAGVQGDDRAIDGGG